MVPPLVVLYAPLVRAFVGASVARELWLGIHAFELSVSPERSLNSVHLAAVDANETPFSNIRTAALAKRLLPIVASFESTCWLERVDSLVRPQQR